MIGLGQHSVCIFTKNIHSKVECVFFLNLPVDSLSNLSIDSVVKVTYLVTEFSLGLVLRGGYYSLFYCVFVLIILLVFMTS